MKEENKRSIANHPTNKEIAEAKAKLCTCVDMECIHLSEGSYKKEDCIVYQAYIAGWKDGHEGYSMDGWMPEGYR